MGSTNIMKNDVTNLWRAPHVGAPTMNDLRRTTYDERPMGSTNIVKNDVANL